MARITAIEIENFQSIQRRTRIDLKPITLLFGPNSAGKSAVFDALELLQTLLDPLAFNQTAAEGMLNRWARHIDGSHVRDTFLAVEFPFEFADVYEVLDSNNDHRSSWFRVQNPSVFMDEGVVESFELEGKTVRIELTLQVEKWNRTTECRLGGFSLFVGGHPLVTLRGLTDQEKQTGRDFESCRRLTMYDDLGTTPGVVSDLEKITDGNVRAKWITQHPHGAQIHAGVEIKSLSPLSLYPDHEEDFQLYLLGIGDVVSLMCSSSSDILFYFGTMLYGETRNQPGIVKADRRAPSPNEALALVDLGSENRWSKGRFSPSSPTSLLKSAFGQVDEFIQGLSEAAHANLVLRASCDVNWENNNTEEKIKQARIERLAGILENINQHLQSDSLFKEKGYQLTCASVLQVPLAKNFMPSDSYALSQPATVRLFLKDSNSQRVDLNDVGSGIPFVLPVLYALACQGFVRVQQPELHLHPALQSGIADVFVEEFNRNGSQQFLLETHSEHILLRMLRRIRDTENGKVISSARRLTHRDLAVYYFDPQVGTGTFITQQLITPLGDFYTDWPKGFFQERNDDLFEK